MQQVQQQRQPGRCFKHAQVRAVGGKVTSEHVQHGREQARRNTVQPSRRQQEHPDAGQQCVQREQQFQRLGTRAGENQDPISRIPDAGLGVRKERKAGVRVLGPVGQLQRFHGIEEVRQHALVVVDRVPLRRGIRRGERNPVEHQHGRGQHGIGGPRSRPQRSTFHGGRSGVSGL